jgi:hypothetical protein
LRQQLQTPAPVPGLHLSLIQVATLEAALGVSVPLTPDTLVAAVERLTGLHLGELRLALTPGQLAELEHRAQKRGRTLTAEMQAILARLHDELFYKGG